MNWQFSKWLSKEILTNIQALLIQDKCPDFFQFIYFYLLIYFWVLSSGGKNFPNRSFQTLSIKGILMKIQHECPHVSIAVQNLGCIGDILHQHGQIHTYGRISLVYWRRDVSKFFRGKKTHWLKFRNTGAPKPYFLIFIGIVHWNDMPLKYAFRNVETSPLHSFLAWSYMD